MKINAIKELADKSYERGRRDADQVAQGMIKLLETRLKREGRIRFGIVAVVLCFISFSAGRVYESHQADQVAYNKDFIELALNLGVKK